MQLTSENAQAMRPLLVVVVPVLAFVAAVSSSRAAATRPPIANEGIPMPTTQTCVEPSADRAVFELRASGVCWLLFPEVTQEP